MREYLPTLGELIDRLTICQLKEVKIPNKKSEYGKEIKQIVSDINKIIKDNNRLSKFNSESFHLSESISFKKSRGSLTFLVI